MISLKQHNEEEREKFDRAITVSGVFWGKRDKDLANNFLTDSNLRTAKLVVEMVKEEVGEDDEEPLEKIGEEGVHEEVGRNVERQRMRKILDTILNK